MREKMEFNFNGALANACWLAMQQTIGRYLLTNLVGRRAGVEKAIRHQELCSFYAAILTGCNPERVMARHEKIYREIHKRTQVALTNCLDETIGFDIHGNNDYDRCERAFFSIFHACAMGVAADYPDVCRSRSLTARSSRCRTDYSDPFDRPSG